MVLALAGMSLRNRSMGIFGTARIMILIVLSDIKPEKKFLTPNLRMA